MTEENNEVITEEVIEEEETEDIDVDKRLQKSVDHLKKLTKIKKEKLTGMTLEEQFDSLSFLYDNMPKLSKTKNRPVVPLPTDSNEKLFGRKIKGDAGKDYYLFKPREWIRRRKKE